MTTVMKPGTGSARYWRAYEWAHNTHHPTDHRLAAFAESYERACDGLRAALSLTEYWDKWSKGEVEQPRWTDREGP